MVFVVEEYSPQFMTTGPVAYRNLQKNPGHLVIECLAGVIVALANIIAVFILIAGWKRLMKNNFFIIVSNLIVFTSMKAVVELSFVIPYYVMQKDEAKMILAYFSDQYELIMFNLSVLADYGILFFSVLIAVDRYLALSFRTSRKNTIVLCVLGWFFAVLIPCIFYCCECQFVYDQKNKRYQNFCPRISSAATLAVSILIYLTYFCVGAVLLLYLLIVITLINSRLRKTQRAMNDSSESEMKLLTQSIVIFALYAGSIFSVLALSCMEKDKFGAFELTYAENLLNLSIAAVYPICLVAMSGEMRSVLVLKISSTDNKEPPAIDLNVF